MQSLNVQRMSIWPHFANDPSCDGSSEIFKGVRLRASREADMAGVRRVVTYGEPWPTAHHQYIYYRDIRCYSNTCRVAEANGEVVGWCSTLPIANSTGDYFLHQLGIAPDYRKIGLGRALVLSVLGVMRRQTEEFTLHFSVNLANKGPLRTIKAAAEIAGMQRIAVLGIVPENPGEQLYSITFPRREKQTPIGLVRAPAPNNSNHDAVTATWTDLHSAATGIYD